MPRSSNLRLNQDQERELCAYIQKRLTSLEETNRARIEADRASWMRYGNDRKDREREGGIWEHSNTPLPITSLVVDYFLSRTHDEVLGETPFFTARPQGKSDRDFARSLERFARYKLCDVGNLEDAIDESLTSIFVQRAAILKAVYTEEIDHFERWDLNALHDTATGEPIEMQEGFILEDAEWIEQPDPVAAASLAAVEPLAPMPTRMHLASDPSFILEPARHAFAPLKEPVHFRRVLYAGPKSVEVESDKFLCPDEARGLDEADFLAEKYDKTADWVLARFTERAWFKLADYRAKLDGTDAKAKTNTEAASDDAPPPCEDDKAEELHFDARTHRTGLVECWMSWDVKNNGRPCRFVAWWDAVHKCLVSYEYQALVSPTGRHPYTAAAVAKRKKRWWGYSLPELVGVFQDYVDQQFNRHSFRNQINANPILGQNPDAIVEKKSFFEVGPFEVVTFEDGKQMQDWLQAFVFPNADLDTETLVDKCIYFLQLWLGISNLSQGDYSDVPQNTTAFGQDSTLREAAKLSRRYSRSALSAIRRHITHLVQVLVATMDQEEVFFYNEGEQSLAGTLSAEAVRALSIDVRLVVGRAQAAQSMQATTLATQLVEKYAQMLATAPWMAQIVRPLYKASLRLLGFDDVDQLLPDPTNPNLALSIPPMQGMTPGAAGDSAVPAPNQSEMLPFPGNAANTAAPVTAGPPEVLDRNAKGAHG